MNGLERYLAVLRGRPADFLPRLPILMQYAAEHIGSHYGDFAADHRVMVRANQRCAADFGIDQLSTISDPYRETQGYGGEVVYVRDGVPRCPHPPLIDNKDLDALPRPNPLTAVRMRDRIDAVHAYRQDSPVAHSIMGWVEGPAAEGADLRGVANFLVDLIDDPPFAGELMDICVGVALDFARAQLDVGAETIGVGDAIASQVSPGLYESLILPREKRLISGLKEMGAVVRLHICGDITHLLPGLTELPIDLIDVDHMVDMVAVRRTLGENVVLTGNIDPAADVRFGDPKTIRQTILDTYAAVGNPYMVNAGCEIPSGTPVENLKALCEPVPYTP